MRFFPAPPSVNKRICQAASRFLNPYRLLPISLLLGDPATHPLLAPPVPFHPIPYARRLSAKQGLLFNLCQPSHHYPPNSQFKKKLLKFLSTPLYLENLSAVKHIKGRFSHTLLLVILNGLLVWGRVHHYWENFDHRCWLCGSPYSDTWPHMLTQCCSTQRLAHHLHSHDPTLVTDFSGSMNRALMAAGPLSPHQIVTRLVFIHTIWNLRYISSFTNTIPSTGLSTFWSNWGKASKQRLLSQARKALTETLSAPYS